MTGPGGVEMSKNDPLVLWPRVNLRTYEADLRKLVLLVQQVNIEGSSLKNRENLLLQRAKKKPMKHG